MILRFDNALYYVLFLVISYYCILYYSFFITETQRKMSTANESDPMNSGYGSSDERATLLTVTERGSTQKLINKSRLGSLPSTNGPTNKPVLIRQDRTSVLFTSPQLSGVGASEDEDEKLKSLQEVEKLDFTDSETIKPVISVSIPRDSYNKDQQVSYNRCKACRNCDRRASSAQISCTPLQIKKSASKESIRSITLYGRFSPQLTKQQSSTIPPVLVTSSPVNGNRIIRQSSQPEQGIYTSNNCVAHTGQSNSLRQLKDQSEGIAGIAGDCMRINGAMRPFKQVFIFYLLSNTYVKCTSCMSKMKTRFYG